MAEEIQEAVQIIRVTYDGLEIALKIGSGGLAAAQKVMNSFVYLLNREKTFGKTSMRKLLLRGGDLQVFQFKEEDLKQVEKLLKKYGVLYSKLPDRNKEDGKMEILFPTEAVSRVNHVARKLMDARIGTYGDYLTGKGALLADEKEEVAPVLMNLFEKTGVLATENKELSIEDVAKAFELGKEEAEKILNRLESVDVIQKQEGSDKYVALVSKEDFEKKMDYYRDLAFKIKVAEKKQNTEFLDITISDTLIREARKDAVKTRVPGTWGDNVRYLWTDKNDILEIHDGKTMLTFLDPDREYKLYDDFDKVVQVVQGRELYSRHYDEVEAAVRERYEKLEKKDKDTKQRGQEVKDKQHEKQPVQSTRQRR